MTAQLCVNGWAQPPDGLRGLADDAQHLDYRHMRNFGETDAAVARLMPQAKLAIGWSLGGAILLHALTMGALQADKLVLIAPVRQFVATPDFPSGMDALTFGLFQKNYAEDPARTAARFSALIAKGDVHEKTVRDACRWDGSADFTAWGGWLEALGDMRLTEPGNLPPTLLLHGGNDGIVPLAGSRLLAEDHPSIRLVVYDRCGHAPHLHDRQKVRAEIAIHAA